MKIEIDEAILEKTTKCVKKFSCLSCPERNLCRVDYCIEDVLFVETELDNHCRYVAPLGYYSTCNCPTRVEIYKRYGI